MREGRCDCDTNATSVVGLPRSHPHRGFVFTLVRRDIEIIFYKRLDTTCSALQRSQEHQQSAVLIVGREEAGNIYFWYQLDK
jgi:hypothetical protein